MLCGRFARAAISCLADGGSPRERGGAVSERLPLLNESYTHLHIDGFSEVVCIAGDDPRLAK